MRECDKFLKIMENSLQLGIDGHPQDLLLEVFFKLSDTKTLSEAIAIIDENTVKKYIYTLPPRSFRLIYTKMAQYYSYVAGISASSKNEIGAYCVFLCNELQNKHINYLDESMSQLAKKDNLQKQDVFEYFYFNERYNFVSKYGTPPLKDTRFFSVRNHFNSILPEVLSERFFEDTSNNVLLELESIQQFYKYYANSLNSEQAHTCITLISFYDALKNLNSENAKANELVDYYSHFKSINFDFMSSLYDMKKTASIIHGNDILNSLTNISKFDSETVNGVKIIYPRDNDFISLISVTDKDRTGSNYKMPTRNFDTVSASLVGKGCLITYRDLRNSLAFGYTSFDPAYLIQANSSDNWFASKITPTDVKALSAYPGEYLPAEQMLLLSKKCKTYSELDILSISEEAKKSIYSKSKDLIKKVPDQKPDYLFCLNGFTPFELSYAKKYNLDIMVVVDKTYQFNGMFMGKKDGVFETTM